MIEIIDAERCTSCDIYVSVCTSNVFDKTDEISAIAVRTCFLCELYCPEDALYVSPFADESQTADLSALKQVDAMGSHRRAIGWTEDTF